jgi:hypothetical protein
VGPKAELAPGAYKATVTISGANNSKAEFNVSFEVLPTGSSGLTIVWGVGDEDRTETVPYGEALTINVEGDGYTDIRWFINDNIAPETTGVSSDGREYIFSTLGKSGTYRIILKVKKDGEPYSSTITVTITGAE